jgi:luxR family regulatory protein
MVEKAEILLVDDHALILEGICHILKRLPEVVVANAVTTGEEAVGLIAERDYDIYILDVGLPDVSGFELIDMIRELNEDARIIVNTMHEEIWYINRLVRQGVNSVILKASDSTEVENAVKSVLRGEAYTCPRFERIRKKLGNTSSQIHPKDVPTKREIEVLQAVAEGLCTHEIAGRLQITENTVETFRRRLIQKFNAKNAIDMVVKAMAQGWINIV